MGERTPREVLRAAVEELRGSANRARSSGFDQVIRLSREVRWADFAEHLAELLEREAVDIQPHTGQAALRVARVILGEEDADG